MPRTAARIILPQVSISFRKPSITIKPKIDGWTSLFSCSYVSDTLAFSPRDYFEARLLASYVVHHAKEFRTVSKVTRSSDITRFEAKFCCLPSSQRNGEETERFLTELLVASSSTARIVGGLSWEDTLCGYIFNLYCKRFEIWLITCSTSKKCKGHT